MAESSVFFSPWHLFSNPWQKPKKTPVTHPLTRDIFWAQNNPWRWAWQISRILTRDIENNPWKNLKKVTRDNPKNFTCKFFLQKIRARGVCVSVSVSVTVTVTVTVILTVTVTVSVSGECMCEWVWVWVWVGVGVCEFECECYFPKNFQSVCVLVTFPKTFM